MNLIDQLYLGKKGWSEYVLLLTYSTCSHSLWIRKKLRQFQKHSPLSSLTPLLLGRDSVGVTGEEQTEHRSCWLNRIKDAVFGLIAGEKLLRWSVKLKNERFGLGSISDWHNHQSFLCQFVPDALALTLTFITPLPVFLIDQPCLILLFWSNPNNPSPARLPSSAHLQCSKLNSYSVTWTTL